MKCFSDNYSKGCKSCQGGKWLCIYLTYVCPANCSFCPSPFKDDRIVSSFGNQKEEILRYLSNNDFNGIGFSGGDPFIKFSRLLNWLYFFKRELPEYYFWTYTSGLTIRKRQLDIIADSGLDEIRFNIAATGYNSTSILDILEYAVKVIPQVVVEIPSIAQHSERLKSVLPILNKIGIRFLNLHEHIIVKQEESIEDCGDFLLNKNVSVNYSTLSLNNTQNIIKYCNEKKLDFKINSCSLEKKEEQLRQRRIKMGHIFKIKDDIIDTEGILYRKIIVTGSNISEIKNQIKKNGFSNFYKKNNTNYSLTNQNSVLQFKLIPPLGLDEDFQLIGIEKIY